MRRQAERDEIFSLERQSLQGDLIMAFQYLKGNVRKKGTDFSGVCHNETRGNGFKLRVEI